MGDSELGQLFDSFLERLLRGLLGYVKSRARNSDHDSDHGQEQFGPKTKGERQFQVIAVGFIEKGVVGEGSVIFCRLA